MKEFLSTKIFKGYSTAFRQWRATHSHCKFIHGYALKFKVTFKGELDIRNWICDFGTFKNNGVKKHLKYMFDHTTVVAKDDPFLNEFKILDEKNLIQLRIMESVGCEKFAEYVFNYINKVISKETKGRVQVLQVECFEGDSNNSAIYKYKNELYQSEKVNLNHLLKKNEI